jgi:hypothetical protein
MLFINYRFFSSHLISPHPSSYPMVLLYIPKAFILYGFNVNPSVLYYILKGVV